MRTTRKSLISREESTKIWDMPLSEEHFTELKEKCLQTWKWLFVQENVNEEYKDEKLTRVSKIKNDGDAFTLLRMFHPLIVRDMIFPRLSPDLLRICHEAFMTTEGVTLYHHREDGSIEIEMNGAV